MELGVIMNDRAWVLNAIQDLQELANQHSLKRVADALDDVLRVANTELQPELNSKYAATKEAMHRKSGEVVSFPANRKPQATWHS